MTKEEAIKNIKEHCYFANLNPKAKKALDFAVKALEQQAIVDLTSMLTDEVLKNAILAYNAIKADRYRGGDDARAIAIAYITSKGREDLKDTFEKKENEE